MKNKSTVFVHAHRAQAAALAAVAAIVFYLFVGPSAGSSPLQQQGPTPQELFLATAQERADWMESMRIAKVNAARYGIEANRSGFHLVRPDDDPMWTNDSSIGYSGVSYCWDFPQPKYFSIVYNAHGLAEGYVPHPDMQPFCMLSLSRVFSNSLASLAVVPESNNRYGVNATFPARSIGALAARLQPIQSDPSYGITDWFGTTRASGQPETKMKVVLVCNDFAYKPFVVQDVVAQSPGPVVVQIATDLSLEEAQLLVSNFAL